MGCHGSSARSVPLGTCTSNARGAGQRYVARAARAVKRCQMEECNHCGLSHDFRCKWRRVANGDAITRSKLRRFEGGDSCSEGEADGSLSVWAGAPAVGGHGRSAEGQAGSSAASRERPAVARRAGEAARASARQVAPRLADSRRLDAVTNSSPESRGEMARRFRDAVQLRRAAGRAKTTKPLSHRSEATAGS